jgi:protein-S-isoprenylcysteine O-methyltransferase Ste14
MDNEAQADVKRWHQIVGHAGPRKILMVLRIPLGIAAIALLALNADPDWLVPGLIVSALGALGQLWCFACIRPRKLVCVDGPYAFVRNPMYLARYVLIAGGVMVLGNPWLLAGCTVVYGAYAVTRVGREERRMQPIFNEEYVAYCKDVPRFLPQLRPRPGSRILHANRTWFDINHGTLNAVCVVSAYAFIVAVYTLK